jgi:hypothetical protein
MAKLSVFEPPSCCASGDDTQLKFKAALEWAQKQGVEIERFNLSAQPGAFADNATVKDLLDKDGMDCLPLVFVDDEVFAKGTYPSRAELSAKLGIAAAE